MRRVKIQENGYMLRTTVEPFMLYLKGKSGESYNVGSGVNIKNIDLVKKLLKISKKLKIKIGKKQK